MNFPLWRWLLTSGVASVAAVACSHPPTPRPPDARSEIEDRSAPETAGADGRPAASDGDVTGNTVTGVGGPAGERADAAPTVSDAPRELPIARDAQAQDRGVASTDGPAASSVNGFRWEVPCASKDFVVKELCTGPREITASRTFGGDPGRVYQVDFRIRGLVEPRLFLDAARKRVTTVTPAPFFGVDVTPDPGNANYAAFSMAVSEPKGTYYLNVFHTIDGPFHHQLMPIDYRASVKIKGGATIVFSYKDGNTEFVANFKKVVVPGVAPAPEAWNGMFAQLDVVSMTEAK